MSQNVPGRLIGLVEYQEGAVVSKTLIKKSGGTVTLFAFDGGQELSEHSTSFEAMVVVLDGAAEMTVANRRYTVKQGETLMLPAGVPHAVKAVERFKMLLTMVRP